MYERLYVGLLAELLLLRHVVNVHIGFMVFKIMSLLEVHSLRNYVLYYALLISLNLTNVKLCHISIIMLYTVNMIIYYIIIYII